MYVSVWPGHKIYLSLTKDNETKMEVGIIIKQCFSACEGQMIPFCLIREAWQVQDHFLHGQYPFAPPRGVLFSFCFAQMNFPEFT